MDLELLHVVCWLCDLLQSFSKWVTVLRQARPEVECARFTAKCFVEFTGITLSFQSWLSKRKQYSHAETSRVVSTSFLPCDVRPRVRSIKENFRVRTLKRPLKDLGFY